MLRNLLVVLTGALLSYVFALAGSRLAWLLIIGNVENSDNKGALVRLMIVQTFVVIPGIAIMVGVFVGVLVQRSRWWLGGVTFLPFTVLNRILNRFVVIAVGLFAFGLPLLLMMLVMLVSAT